MHKFAARREKRQKGIKQKAYLLPPSPQQLLSQPTKKVKQALDATKLVTTMEGAKAFELYGNVSSGETRQPWEKIAQAQMIKCPWEDIYRVTHDETPSKTCNSFMECIIFHLQQVFRHDMGKTLKYYITNTLRKPNRIPICQFFCASQTA